MAASHDQSKRESATTSTATQNNIAASEQSQTIATVVTGNKNTTYGAGSSNTTQNVKGDLTINSIDQATIEGAFGLTRDVVENLAQLASGFVASTNSASEANTAAVAQAFEHFGSEMSTVTQRQVDAFTPDGGKDKIILTLFVVGGIVAAAALLRTKKSA